MLLLTIQRDDSAVKKSGSSFAISITFLMLLYCRQVHVDVTVTLSIHTVEVTNKMKLLYIHSTWYSMFSLVVWKWMGINDNVL